MVQLNAKGEVADLLDVNQFIPGRSAYECVAYAASLVKYAGQPGKGPTGSALQASNLAQYWYGREEGSTGASNTNGMILQDEYNMLDGMGLHYYVSSPTVAHVKAWLEVVGYPLLMCGAETGMYDIGLGDRVPYTWTPTGNHCIVASGVAHDGNLLVHDCANIAPNGVRTGPRTYDASKLQLISATAIVVPWQAAVPANFDPTKESVDVSIGIHTPGISEHFVEQDAHHWQSKATGAIIQFAMLSNFKSEGNRGLCGWDVLGDPMRNEKELGAPYPKGTVIQPYRYGVRMWRPDTGQVTPIDIYSGPGQDPYVGQLQAVILTCNQEIAQLKARQLTPAQTLVDALNELKALHAQRDTIQAQEGSILAKV